MYINRKLNEYVTANGIKQIYIVQKTGLSADTISKILKGKRRILADEFLTICVALDIDPNIFRVKPTEEKTA